VSTWRLRAPMALFLFVAFCVAGAALAVADQPVAQEDWAATSDGVPIIIDVLANDTGLGDVPITVILVEIPVHGTAAVDAGGSILYRPQSGYQGEESFRYRVTDLDGEFDEASVTVFVNGTPMALDERIYTPKGQAVTLALRADDPNIDPTDPLAHPLVFSVVSRPSSGELAGDLTNVRYEETGIAVVDLVYTPDPDFVGVAEVIFAVTDPFEAVSTGTMIVDVGQRSTGDRLSGSAAARLMLGPPFTILSFDTRLWTRYWHRDLGLEGILVYDDTGWTEATFLAEYGFEGVFAAQGTLSLLPLIADLNYLKVVSRLGMDGISFTHTLYLPGSGPGYHELDMRARLCDASVRAELRLGLSDAGSGCAHGFERFEAGASWPWAECGVRVDALLIMLCPDGFDSWSVTLRDIPLLSLGGGGILDVFAQLRTTFTVDEKIAEGSLKLKLPASGVCLRLFADLVTNGGGLHFDGIDVDQLKLQVTLPNVVTCIFEESLNDGTELLSLTGPVPTCCGGPGQWSARVTFPTPAGAPVDALFDWNSFAFEINVPLGEQFELAASAFWDWSGDWSFELGWGISW